MNQLVLDLSPTVCWVLRIKASRWGLTFVIDELSWTLAIASIWCSCTVTTSSQQGRQTRCPLGSCGGGYVVKTETTGLRDVVVVFGMLRTLVPRVRFCLARVPPHQNTWYPKRDNHVHTKATALCRQHVLQPQPAVKLSRQYAPCGVVTTRAGSAKENRLKYNEHVLFFYPLLIISTVAHR